MIAYEPISSLVLTPSVVLLIGSYPMGVMLALIVCVLIINFVLLLSSLGFINAQGGESTEKKDNKLVYYIIKTLCKKAKKDKHVYSVYIDIDEFKKLENIKNEKDIDLMRQRAKEWFEKFDSVPRLHGTNGSGETDKQVPESVSKSNMQSMLSELKDSIIDTYKINNNDTVRSVLQSQSSLQSQIDELKRVVQTLQDTHAGSGVATIDYPVDWRYDDPGQQNLFDDSETRNKGTDPAHSDFDPDPEHVDKFSTQPAGQKDAMATEDSATTASAENSTDREQGDGGIVSDSRETDALQDGLDDHATGSESYENPDQTTDWRAPDTPTWVDDVIDRCTYLLNENVGDDDRASMGPLCPKVARRIRDSLSGQDVSEAPATDQARAISLAFVYGWDPLHPMESKRCIKYLSGGDESDWNISYQTSNAPSTSRDVLVHSDKHRKEVIDVALERMHRIGHPQHARAITIVPDIRWQRSSTNISSDVDIDAIYYKPDPQSEDIGK